MIWNYKLSIILWIFFIWYVNADDWINCSTAQLTDWTCTMAPYDVLNVQPHSTDLKSFSVDLFWWATMFIGFIVFVALIYSGLLMILWWADEKQLETGKKWVKYSIIWLLLVWWAYWIVKFIQLIAKG